MGRRAETVVAMQCSADATLRQHEDTALGHEEKLERKCPLYRKGIVEIWLCKASESFRVWKHDVYVYDQPDDLLKFTT